MATASSSASSSKGWMSNIQSIASRIYFFLIVLQIPLFRYCNSLIYSHSLTDYSFSFLFSSNFSLILVPNLLVYLGVLCLSSYTCFSIWVLLVLGFMESRLMLNPEAHVEVVGGHIVNPGFFKKTESGMYFRFSDLNLLYLELCSRICTIFLV